MKDYNAIYAISSSYHHHHATIFFCSHFTVKFSFKENFIWAIICSPSSYVSNTAINSPCLY